MILLYVELEYLGTLKTPKEGLVIVLSLQCTSNVQKDYLRGSARRYDIPDQAI